MNVSPMPALAAAAVATCLAAFLLITLTLPFFPTPQFFATPD